MAKTRMNQGHRDVLRNFAYKKIEDVVNLKPCEKLRQKLVTLTNKVIRKKFSEKDIEILRKYNLTTRDNCVKYQFPNGSVNGLTFKAPYNKDKGEYDHELVEIPYRRGCNSQDVYPVDEEFETIFHEYAKLKNANEAAITSKKRDCDSLINFAKYIEDVLEVIKVPKDIEESLLAKSTALVALSPEIVARIQADFNS